jgi:hypothetical protein
MKNGGLGQKLGSRIEKLDLAEGNQNWARTHKNRRQQWQPIDTGEQQGKQNPGQQACYRRKMTGEKWTTHGNR